MGEKFIDVKEVALKNNCPECYNNSGLRLTFKQKIKDTKFYKSITPDIDHEMICTNCKLVIYPVQWTDDIERVFEYQKKAFVPKTSSTFLKKGSWIAIVLVFILMALILFLVFYLNL
jgi:preprotein translocase subunit SecF